MPQPLVVEAEPVTSRRRFVAGLAASLAVAMAGGGYLLSSRRAYAETAVGEKRVVQLPGGSRAELNTDTQIGWHLGTHLDLWLERGEAAVTVAGGLGHPFRVRTAPMQALLGHGRYDLRLEATRARLIALSGLAMVTGNSGAQLVLHSGQSLEADGIGLRVSTLSARQIDVATAWQHGTIVFDGMTLAAALGEFNRYLPQPIELGDAGLGAVRLGGRFNTDDPQGFLLALHDSFGIDHRLDGQRILLTPAS
jgi:transmembrane sensor